MSPIFLLAATVAIKKKQDEERAMHAKQERQRKLEEDERARKEKYSSSTARKTEHSYGEAVNEEMLKDPSLREFFETLKKTAEDLALEDCAEQMEECEALIQKETTAKQALDAVTELLNENERIKPERVIKSIYLYGGLPLTREMLEDENKVKFRSDYEAMHEKNDAELSEKEIKLPKRLKTLQWRIKYLPIGRDKNHAEAEQIESTLEEIKRRRDDEARAKKRADDYDKLTPDDKKSVLDHIDKAKVYDAATEEVSAKKDEIIHIKECETKKEGYSYYTEDPELKKNRLQRALGRMLQEEQIDEKGLEEIYNKLDKVGIKASRGEYDFGYWNHEKGEVEKLEEVRDWFIEDVYEKDEHFLNRNAEVEKEYGKNKQEDDRVR